MENKFSYYYNKMPNGELWRNNLIYTSLINEQKTVFVQHYTTSGDYHRGQNEVVDPNLMNEKWSRELCYLTRMSTWYPDLVPKILDIDLLEKKIYLEIDGVDFWQRSLDENYSFDEILPDWQDQMLNIIRAHKDLELYKYSMHPSSYFVVDGKLKSINYFFTYSYDAGPISIADHQSHLSDKRKEKLRIKAAAAGLEWDKKYPLDILEQLCWESFRDMYPDDFIEKAKCIK